MVLEGLLLLDPPLWLLLLVEEPTVRSSLLVDEAIVRSSLLVDEDDSLVPPNNLSKLDLDPLRRTALNARDAVLPDASPPRFTIRSDLALDIPDLLE